jgi:hypothetical protein
MRSPRCRLLAFGAERRGDDTGREVSRKRRRSITG